MSDDENIHEVTLRFNECVIRGGWEKIKNESNSEIIVWSSFKVLNEDTAELWIVTPDGAKEGWSFKLNSIIQKGPHVIQFNQEDVKSELAAVEQKDDQQVTDERGIIVSNLSEEHYLLKCEVCGTTTVLKEISPGTTLEDELSAKTCSRCGGHGNWKVISTF